MRFLYGVPILLLFIVNIVCAQDSTLQKVPVKYFSQVNGKSKQMQQQADKHTAKALQDKVSGSLKCSKREIQCWQT
jgi:hypothetical protein